MILLLIALYVTVGECEKNGYRISCAAGWKVKISTTTKVNWRACTLNYLAHSVKISTTTKVNWRACADLLLL